MNQSRAAITKKQNTNPPRSRASHTQNTKLLCIKILRSRGGASYEYQYQSLYCTGTSTVERLPPTRGRQRCCVWERSKKNRWWFLVRFVRTSTGKLRVAGEAPQNCRSSCDNTCRRTGKNYPHDLAEPTPNRPWPDGKLFSWLISQYHKISTH